MIRLACDARSGACQIGFVHAKRRLGFGELDVGLPQRLVGPFVDVGAKDVHAFGELGPLVPLGRVLHLSRIPAAWDLSSVIEIEKRPRHGNFVPAAARSGARSRRGRARVLLFSMRRPRTVRPASMRLERTARASPSLCRCDWPSGTAGRSPLPSGPRQIFTSTSSRMWRQSVFSAICLASA